jgi:chromosome segregation ATPase
MSSASAELSSLSTALEEIRRRVVGLSDQFSSARREDLAGELAAVERQLHHAVRRLDKVVASTPQPGGSSR